MDSADCPRSLPEIERILGFAKLDGTELNSSVQCISFKNDLDNDSLLLLEVNNDMINQLEAGDRLTLRGNKTDSVVLCTKDKTYDLKEAETSNTLLVTENCLVDSEAPVSSEKTLSYKQVVALKHLYYELKPIKPRLQRLKHLLEENFYSGREYEEDDNHQGKTYTYDELLNEVQASDEELFDGLQRLQALVIHGCWRILDIDLISKVIESILSLIDEKSWTIDTIPMKECCAVLSEQYLRNLTKHVLECYGHPVAAGGNQESVDIDDAAYALDEDKVCKFYGELILRDSKKFNLEEFLKIWQLSVPDSMATSLYQLEGLALVDKSSKPHVIKYFPAIELPEDIQDRFKALFQAKDKWTLQEVTPYVKDLTTPKLGVGNLLTKYARVSSLNGIKVYGSKM